MVEDKFIEDINKKLSNQDLEDVTMIKDLMSTTTAELKTVGSKTGVTKSYAEREKVGENQKKESYQNVKIITDSKTKNTSQKNMCSIASIICCSVLVNLLFYN